MWNTLLQIVFTIPILILVSCTSLPFTRSTTSPTPTETPTNTSTPSPTATITPNFSATQQAVELQETQIAQETQNEIFAQETQISLEATATAQEVSVQATAQADATKQAKDAEFEKNIAAFYKEAEEKGVVFKEFRSENGELKNESEHCVFRFTKGFLYGNGKSIADFDFPTDILDNLGLFNLRIASSIMFNEYGVVEYEQTAALPHKRDLSVGEIKNYIQPIKNKLPILIPNTDASGNVYYQETNRIIYQFATSYEYKILKSLAQKYNIPIMIGLSKSETPVFNQEAFSYSVGDSRVVILYDLSTSFYNKSPAGKAFELLGPDASYYAKFFSFFRTWRHASKLFCASMLGEGYQKEILRPYILSYIWPNAYCGIDSRGGKDCSDLGQQVFGYK